MLTAFCQHMQDKKGYKFPCCNSACKFSVIRIVASPANTHCKCFYQYSISYSAMRSISSVLGQYWTFPKQGKMWIHSSQNPTVILGKCTWRKITKNIFHLLRINYKFWVIINSLSNENKDLWGASPDWLSRNAEFCVWISVLVKMERKKIQIKCTSDFVSLWEGIFEGSKTKLFEKIKCILVLAIQ